MAVAEAPMDTAADRWIPKRSIAECNAIITATGAIHEMEVAVIDGRVQRIYKNQAPSLREFWLSCVERFGNHDHVVFENDRYTYAQMHERASRFASILYLEYGVRKGDRVAVLMRNLPEWLMCFWAAHLIGAVAVLINAWGSNEALVHCIILTDPKVLITDGERASRLASPQISERLRSARLALLKTLVVRPQEHSKHERGKWKGMQSFDDVMARYRGSVSAWETLQTPVPEDNATIFFTSGTTGLPKGVLSTQRQFLVNYMNAMVTPIRALLRAGQNIPPPDPNVRRAVLISVPLFHVTGCTSMMIGAANAGGKVVLMRKWNKEEAARLIIAEDVTLAGGVPSMAMDLLETALARSGTSSQLRHRLEGLSFGGAPPAETLADDIRRKMPGLWSTNGYGMTECNAIAATILGDDFVARPTSTGLAPPVVDLLIMDPKTMKALPPGEIGELWIRGPNVMKGYWRDQEATDKTVTKDGWLRSGDLASMDEEGFVFIRDRVKDIIIRGGENIHCIEVENALYLDERLIDAAAVSVLDRRLGELVAAVVATKPSFHGQVAEEEVIAIARKTLPSHAVPVLILVQSDMLERNAAGKVLKDKLRTRVREEWKRRQRTKVKAKL